MDYATKELTQSLQQIAAREADSEQHQGVTAGDRTYSTGVLNLPTGVDGFLATRRDFQEKTRNVSVGSY